MLRRWREVPSGSCGRGSGCFASVWGSSASLCRCCRRRRSCCYRLAVSPAVRLACIVGWLAAQGTFVATIGTGFVVAVLASVMNNMPATLVGALAIDRVDVPAFTQELMAYANIVGND